MKYINKFDSINESKGSAIPALKVWSAVVDLLPDLAGKKWSPDTTLADNYTLADVMLQISYTSANNLEKEPAGFYVASENGNKSYIQASHDSIRIADAIKKAMFDSMTEYGEAGDALAELVDLYGKNLSKEWVDSWFKNRKNKKS